MTYTFNDFNVCIDPTWVYKELSDKLDFCIGIASDGNYWSYCISIRSAYSYSGSLPSLFEIERNRFTLQECMIRACNSALISLDNLLADENSCKPGYLNDLLKKERSKLNFWINSIKQHEYSFNHMIHIIQSKNVLQTSLF